jgi:hypothetical protein
MPSSIRPKQQMGREEIHRFFTRLFDILCLFRKLARFPGLNVSKFRARERVLLQDAHPNMMSIAPCLKPWIVEFHAQAE